MALFDLLYYMEYNYMICPEFQLITLFGDYVEN